MAPKLITAVVVLILNIAAGFAGFFVLLLALNGFSEREANYGIGSYIVMVIVGTIVMTASAVVVVHLLMKREFRGVTSALIAIPVFSGAGAALKILFIIIAAIITGEVRRAF